MATPAQIKKRHKYADKPKQVINNNICLNLGEHNHIDYETFNSAEYNKALARAKRKIHLQEVELLFGWKVTENR